MSYFKFELIHQSKKSRARVGRIYTPHGIIDTPNFVGVGTNAALKSVDSVMVSHIGMQLMFCNTYHLMLQPGTEIIKNAGGLHNFMNRKMPIITDSGGFQVFSLAYGTVKDELKSRGQKKGDNLVLKTSEDGVLFRSYRDGTTILLTPETSIAAQKDLGADIIIPFDELPPYHIDQSKLSDSLQRTHRWEKRSLDAHLTNKQNQAMYSVIHGGISKELRKESCEVLTKLPFDGHAIGGSMGKNREEMVEMLTFMMPLLPQDKPNHLLGIGDLASIEPCITLGVDTFDSSHPTRCARHGLLFTTKGFVKIGHAANKMAFEPIDVTCSCYTCQNFTRAYLHHLFKAAELSAYTLATIHNLHFMVQLMEDYRNKILNDKL
ncbi:MAG TPA: tRNA guanosine(34) transglycosylase Tgt [Candidatus Babeliales bacterium]|jgi:queuine tRNA-ribosyltransferase|nr:tRNA guanosine(34) transglycosylase Tgt [Candidatus Babeliales bacterium]